MRHGSRTAALLVVVVAACAGPSESIDLPPAPTTAAPTTASTTEGSDPDETDGTGPAEGVIRVTVDASTPGPPISPLILGMSGDLGLEQSIDVGLTLGSWGGNPSSRYNYVDGHSWNHGSDYEFRNTNYGATGDVARLAVDEAAEAGTEIRLAVPTIGWIARNDDPELCSFPDDAGGCLGAGEANCANPGPIADPARANVPSTPEMVAEWVGAMISEGRDIGYIAMDNEPDLWGYTHYDIHPECATYEEILDKHLTYAGAIRDVAPDAALMGPAICCWFDYWDLAPGPADGSGEEFLPWFLRNVRSSDEAAGRRTLDVLDVHFYPQTDVYNENTDPETNARRLRSTRGLWDPDYVDESWIAEPIRFIPRMKETIEANYPGTQLAISEWNFGADTTMNGAMAIAEVLGIYGREGVDVAAYWRNPPPDSPGYHAFKLHGNYDGNGSRFGGLVVPAETSEPYRLGAFAAVDESSGLLRVMLVSKEPVDAQQVELVVEGFDTAEARRWSYGPADPAGIVADSVDVSAGLEVPAETVVLLELDPTG